MESGRKVEPRVSLESETHKCTCTRSYVPIISVLHTLTIFNKVKQGTGPFSAPFNDIHLFDFSETFSEKLISPETTGAGAACFHSAFILSFCLSIKPRGGLLFETKSPELQRVITDLHKRLDCSHSVLDILDINDEKEKSSF